MKLTQVEDAMFGKITKWLKILGRRTAALSIEPAQREWETAIDAVQELIFIHDADLCIVRANRAYAVRAGKTFRDIIGKPYWTLFPKLDGPLPGCRRSLEERQGGEEDLRIGSGEEYVSRTYPIYDAVGKYLYSLHIMQDVTTRKYAAETLKESEERYRTLVETSPDILYTLAEDGTITFLSSAFEKITGWSRDEWLGKPFMPLLHRDDLPLAIESFQRALQGKSRSPLELRVHAKSGGYLIGEFTPIPQAEKGKVSSIVRDITERKRMEEQLNASLAEKEVLVQSLNELATRDGLTGLYNRRAFYTLLEDELARAQRFDRPVSLLLLDIDHFKRVNDTHGHLAGDDVLKELSELLGKEARAIDRVCRYGGEEITVILPETDLETAANAAERLRTAVAAHLFDVDAGAPLRITVSIGVGSWPAHADNAQALVAAADAALYAAKQGGRNRISRYEPAHGQRAAQG